MTVNYSRSDAKAAARREFSGIWAAMTSPFDEHDRLDTDALARDMDYLVSDLGVGGVFCNGVMGEFWALTHDERKVALRTVVDASRGRVPVLAHTGHHSARETIELTRDAHEGGADFAVVINPYYPATGIEGFRAWFRQVLSSVDIGVWLFDTNFSGTTLPLELIDELADIENVCGIKVGHDHARYLETLALVGDRILVCEANESTWLENMRDHGQSVYMSSSTPFLFQTTSWQPMREYTDLALSGEFDKAVEVAATMEPLRALGSKWLHGQWVRERILPIPFIKAWSGLLGMSGGEPRVPLLGLSTERRAELASDLASVGLL